MTLKRIISIKLLLLWICLLDFLLLKATGMNFDFKPDRLCRMVPAAGFNPVEQTMKCFRGAPSSRSRRLPLITRPPAAYGANPSRSRGIASRGIQFDSETGLETLSFWQLKLKLSWTCRDREHRIHSSSRWCNFDVTLATFIATYAVFRESIVNRFLINPDKRDKCVNEIIFCQKSAENNF